MVKKDQVQVTAVLDGKQPLNELGKLEMQANEYRHAMRGMKKNTDEYVTASKRLKETEARIGALRKELGTTGMTMQQLTRYQRDLMREMNLSTTRGTARYKELKREVLQVSAAINKQRMEVRGLNTMWSRVGKEVKQFGVLALGYLGITTLITQLGNLIQRSGDYSDALAQVRKTTGLTVEETDRLSASLKSLDTRTARKELLAMAKVAGKLGITSLPEVEGFVAAFDKINVALGEDLGDPEEVARKLGKLMESFQVKDTYGIEQGLLKVGSAINHLGKSSVANEGAIVEFTKRLAGVAPLAKLSIQDVMGLGAANDALGQTMEVSSTALSKLFIKMANNKEMFAKYAKDANGASMSTSDFARLIETDFNEAFISLLRGVRDNSSGMNELAATLGDLELDGGRVIGVLGTLANNIDFVQKQQQIAREEFEKGTSVLNEFNTMNETFGAQLSKIGKAIYAKFVNSGFVAFLENLVSKFQFLIPPIKTATDRMHDMNAEMNIELETLKTGNLTQEARRKLIEDINTKYGDYLPRLIDEKDTLAEINDLQKDVNSQMLQRILIMQHEEELTALVERKVEAIRNEIEANKQLKQIEQDIAKGRLTGKEAEDMRAIQQSLLSFAQMDQQIAEEQLSSLRAEFDKLKAQFGLEDFTPGGAPTDPNYDPVDSEGLKEKENALDDFYNRVMQMREELDMHLMDKDKAEIARVEAKYRKMQEEALNLYGEQKLNDEQYADFYLELQRMMEAERQAIVDAQKEQKAKDKAAAQEEIRTALMSEREQEIAQVSAHYDRLIELARKYNLDVVELEKAKAAAIAGINSKTVNENLQKNLEALDHLGTAFGGLSDFFGNMNTLMGGQSKALVKLQIALGFAEVLAHHGVAISAATRQAAGTSFTPWGFAAKIALFMSAITAQIVRAKQMMAAANQAANVEVPTAKQGERARPVSFYHGGETGMNDMGFGDQYGPYAGYVHQNEMVVPHYVRHKPAVVDAERMIKAAMNGFTLPSSTGAPTGGATSSTSEKAADTMMMAAMMMADTYEKMRREGMPAYFVPDELDKGLDYRGRKEKTRARGRL